MNHLCSPKVYQLLEDVDQEWAQRAYEEGCIHCGSRLHRGDYTRKPRGGPQWDRRHSFTCAREGCRKRKTPPSVRFLGPKVYAGSVVLLVSAMHHGLGGRRAEGLSRVLGVDARTLRRWLKWWSSTFGGHAYWKAQRGLFMPPVDEGSLAHGLVERFGAESEKGLLKVLKFISPITTESCWGVQVM